MIVGKVIGSIVSTRKSEKLVGNKFMLIAPLWSADKRNVLNLLHRRLKQNAIRQGQCYESGTDHPL